MSTDVRMLHTPDNEINVRRLMDQVSASAREHLESKALSLNAQRAASAIVQNVLAKFPLQTSNATAGHYVGFRVVDGKSPHVVLRWRTEKGEYFWERPMKFSSRRRARVWAKEAIANRLPIYVEFTPVLPVNVIEFKTRLSAEGCFQ